MGANNKLLRLNHKQKVFSSILLTCTSDKEYAVKKTYLEFEPDYDFKLIALISALPAHTLCWWMEQKLKLSLQRGDELVLTSKRGAPESYYPVFFNLNEEENYQRWTILGNKSGNGFLIPEQKVVDYYVKIEGDIDRTFYLSVLNTLKEIQGIVHLFDVKPETLKSKANLVL